MREPASETMSHFLRFLCTDEAALTAEQVERALKGVDERYELRDPEIASATLTDLFFDGELLAELDINTADDEIVRAEIRKLSDRLPASDGERARRVRDTLDRTRWLVAAEMFQHRDRTETRQRLEPLWRWLFGERRGLLQVDGEGYRDADGLVLPEDG